MDPAGGELPGGHHRRRQGHQDRALRAFVELGDSIEGLVHISEMAGRHIDTPAQVVHAGDDVKVKVMEINRIAAAFPCP